MKTDKLDEVLDLVNAKRSIPYGLVAHCNLTNQQKERLEQFIKSRGYAKNGTAYIREG